MHARFLRYFLAAVFALTLPMTAAAGDAPAPGKAAHASSATPDLQAQRRELDQLRGQMRELSRKMADLSMKMGDVGPRAYAWRYIGNPDRGMLGLVLRSGEHGMHIDAVTPGGPAEKAGVRDGDTLTAINGKPLTGKNADAGRHELDNLKVGQAVKLTIRRDNGKTEKSIGVTAERREPYNLAFAFGDGGHGKWVGRGNLPPKDFDEHVQAQVERAMRQAHVAERAGESARRAIQHMRLLAPWWGLNLVGLNPDLGSYFGTDKGVLVLSADNDAFKALKSGDVLLDIAGQKVQRPEDALRLLREQSPGHKVDLRVLRRHKTLRLSMTVPENMDMFVPPPPPPPPAAPAPPAPPHPGDRATSASPAPPAIRALPPAPPVPDAPPAPPPPPPHGDQA